MWAGGRTLTHHPADTGNQRGPETTFGDACDICSALRGARVGRGTGEEPKRREAGVGTETDDGRQTRGSGSGGQNPMAPTRRGEKTPIRRQTAAESGEEADKRKRENTPGMEGQMQQRGDRRAMDTAGSATVCDDRLRGTELASDMGSDQPWMLPIVPGPVRQSERAGVPPLLRH